MQFDSALKQQIRDNRHILQQIAEALFFCGRQCIALHGSAENLLTAGNPGNLLAFLKQMAKKDELLKQHLESPVQRNATYLTPKSQNEIIDIIGKHQIPTAIIQEIKEAKFFVILADEVTSHNQEQVVLL